MAVDLDVKKGKDGIAAWHELCNRLGISTNGTLEAETPSGGRHLIYRATPGAHVGSATDALASGIDVKAELGYIVVAPSEIDGKPYRWRNLAEPLSIPEPLLPLLPGQTQQILPPTTPAPKKSGLIVGTTGAAWGDGKRAFDRVREALEARGYQLKKTTKGYITRCPAHDDNDPSLSIGDKSGRVLLKCFSGCTVESILAALGLHPGDLFDNALEEQQSPRVAEGRPEAPALPPSEIVITCAADLQSREFKPLRFVVPAILPEGLLLFSGASKIGKTSLLCYIATRIALGLPVFGFPVERAGVLLLLLEDPLRRVKARLVELLGAETWPANLHVVDMFAGFPKIGQGAEAAVTGFLTKNPDIKLVGVDILNRIMPEQRRGSSVYAGDVAAMKQLHEIANQQHVAMPVLHHDGKAAKLNTDFVDNASGSAGLVGTADNVWNIKRTRGENVATLAITGREIEEQSLALRREGHAWHLIGTGAAADIEITEGRAEILEVFDGEHLYPREILNRLCGDDQGARTRTERVFYRLVKVGAIVKDSRGRYYRAGDAF